jgi:hypothetical protein
MKRLIILLLIVCFHQVKSQNKELNIATKFIENGDLFINPELNINVFSHFEKNRIVLVQFKKEEKCLLLEYFGDKVYKIKYKKWIGYISSDFIFLNNQLKSTLEKEESIQEKELKSEIAIIQKPDEVVQVKNIEKVIEKVNNDTITTDDFNNAKETISETTLKTDCHYLINEIDSYENIELIKTDNYWVNNDLRIELYKKGNKKYVFFNYQGNLGCASLYTDNRSFVKVILENDNVITFYHTWDIDCGDFSLKGILSNSNMQKLQDSPIKSILLHGTKGNMEIENLEYKEFFIDKLKCLN